MEIDVLKQIGYTPGCPGCRALQTGRTRVGHSDDCRKRAVEKLKETVFGRERISAARKREDDFLARAVQQSDGLASKRAKNESHTVVTSSVAATQVDGSGGVIAAVPVTKDSESTIPAVPMGTEVDMSMPTSSYSSSSMQVSNTVVGIAQAPPHAKRAREAGDEGD